MEIEYATIRLTKIEDVYNDPHVQRALWESKRKSLALEREVLIDEGQAELPSLYNTSTSFLDFSIPTLQEVNKYESKFINKFLEDEMYALREHFNILNKKDPTFFKGFPLYIDPKFGQILQIGEFIDLLDFRGRDSEYPFINNLPFIEDEDQKITHHFIDYFFDSDIFSYLVLVSKSYFMRDNQINLEAVLIP